MVGAATHCNLSLCNSMQLRTAQTAFRRKRKRLALTLKGRNGLIWEHLDVRMEFLGYLKVIVPFGINLVEFDRTKLDHTFKRKLSHPNERQTYSKYFSDSKNVPVCSFCKEPTTVVDLREAGSMVVDSDPASICCSRVMPSESNT